MGGWNSKGKVELEGLNNIRANLLKSKGFFKNSLHGVASWTSSWSGKTNGITIQTTLQEDTGYLRIAYTISNQDTGEKQDFDYNIPLTSTPCPYGGRRFWFICPLFANGIYCGRRIGVLYRHGNYFGCRKCHRLTYARQNYGGRYKGFVSIPDIEEAEKKVKRYYYRGKPTRQYRKVLRLNEGFEMGFIKMAKMLKYKL